MNLDVVRAFSPHWGNHARIPLFIHFRNTDVQIANFYLRNSPTLLV
jgi:hypothetical protein